MGTEFGVLLQIVGVAVALLTLLDWSLTPKQKKAVTGWAETAWLWLSDQRARGYLEMIVTARAQYVITLTMIAIFGLGILILLITFLHVKAVDPEFAEEQLFISLPAYAGVLAYLVILHGKVTRWLLAGADFKSFGNRLVLLTVIALLIAGLPSIVITDGYTDLHDQSSGRYIYLFMAPMAFAISPAVVFLILLCIWGLWEAMVSLLMVIYRVLEFIMLRVASYEKGPLLGLSAVLLAIGLLIKSFTGSP